MIYEALVRPLLFTLSPTIAHELTLRGAALLDALPLPQPTYPDRPCIIGKVALPTPMMIAAGLVKGHGFDSEKAAISYRGNDLIPGFRSLPLFLGPTEFGFFTRYPRVGNPGTVLWRHRQERALQNRVGLRNPGAAAAAHFLGRQRDKLPPIFGVNIAVSPGVTDPEAEATEVRESVALFLAQNVAPAWFTINLSCPNTDDDARGHQSTEKLRQIVTAVRTVLPPAIPLWCKIGPELGEEQLRALLHEAEAQGVAALIATNTLPRPTPDSSSITAGMSGAPLRAHALRTVSLLATERARQGFSCDVIGCGGVLDGTSARAFFDAGACGLQIWSALVYRGLFAPRKILKEVL